MSGSGAEAGGWASLSVSASGLASLGLGGLFWLWSRAERSKLEQLKSIASHERLDELLSLKALMPLLVAVRGRVCSSCPKKCELSDDFAVIHEVVEEEIWRKMGARGRVANEHFEIKRSSDRSEWFLEDGVSTTRVKVENVVQAEQLSSVLRTRHVFVAADPSKLSFSGLAQELFEKSWNGRSKLGIRKTEHYLPVGSVVTVIGQLDQSLLARAPLQAADAVARGAVASAAAATVGQPGGAEVSGSVGSGIPSASPGAPKQGVPKSMMNPFGSGSWGKQPAVQEAGLLVRRPVGGGPFVITPLTVEELREKLLGKSLWLKYTALGLGTIGVSLLAYSCLMRLLAARRAARTKRRIEQIREQRMQMAARGGGAAGAAAEGEDAASAAGGGADDRMAGLCVVCIDRSVRMVFTSCGHLCCCEECGLKLSRCPVCRVRGTPIKVYQP